MIDADEVRTRGGSVYARPDSNRLELLITERKQPDVVDSTDLQTSLRLDTSLSDGSG